MEKFFIVLYFTSFSFCLLSAQTFTATDEKLLADACTCINKIDANSKNKLSEAQNCVSTAVIPYIDAIQKENKIDLTNSEQASTYGRRIGERLVHTCKKFQEIAEGVAAQEMQNEEKSVGKISTGTFVRVEKDCEAKLIFKDADGKEVAFIWLTNFPKSELFMSKATPPVGKTFKITWTEIEIYVPKADGYYTVKQILSVE